MSFQDFKVISTNNPGTTIRYGGNDTKEIMRILNGEVISNRRPRIASEWLWLDHFDIKPPIAGEPPVAPTETNSSRIYVDPDDFKLKAKKTNDTVVELENVNIPDSALQQILNRAKLPSPTAFEDESNTFSEQQKIHKAAEAGIAEALLELKVSDDTSGSSIAFNNLATGNAVYAPAISGTQASSSGQSGLAIFGRISAAMDTGTTPVLILDARRTDFVAVATRPVIDFRNNGTSLLKLTPTQIDHTSKTLINPGNILINTLDNTLGAHYLDVQEMAIPANPSSGTRRLFTDSTTGQLSIKNSVGTVVSLETGGGGGGDVTLNGVQTLTNKGIGDFLKFVKQGSSPADPALEDLIVYAKSIDANTNGVFIKGKMAGAIFEVQIFP